MSGKTGTGKSFSAIELACALDPDFTVDRIAFSADEFLTLVRSGLDPGSFIVADEVSSWFGARDYMSKINKGLGSLIQTFRVMQLGVIFTLPEIWQVDKNLRFMGDVYMETQKIMRKDDKVLCKWYNIEKRAISDTEPFTKFPVIRSPDGYKKTVTKVYIGRMDPDLEKAYTEKKLEFTERNNASIHARIKTEDGSDNHEEQKKPVKIKMKCMKCGNMFISKAKVPRCGCRSYDIRRIG